MARDSILDEAEQKNEQNTDADTESSSSDDTGADGEESRTRLTQRVPDDLLDDVDAVKEEFHLPSRNAAINFMLTRAADDLLDED